MIPASPAESVRNRRLELSKIFAPRNELRELRRMAVDIVFFLGVEHGDFPESCVLIYQRVDFMMCSSCFHHGLFAFWPEVPIPFVRIVVDEFYLC